MADKYNWQANKFREEDNKWLMSLATQGYDLVPNS